MPHDNEITKTCLNEECSNEGSVFDDDDENIYCPKCGQKLVRIDAEGNEVSEEES